MFVSATTLLGLVFGAFVVFVLVMRSVRRRTHAPSKALSFDFSLEELHRLHRDGQLNAEEFERAKAVVLARKGAAIDPSGPSARAKERGFDVLPPAGT